MSSYDRKQIHQDILRQNRSDKGYVDFVREQVNHYRHSSSVSSWLSGGLMVLSVASLSWYLLDGSHTGNWEHKYLAGSAATFLGSGLGGLFSTDMNRHKESWQQELSRLEEQLGE
ncbi:hypothetical protein ACFL0V_02260 [Nanoarchaeota archaeon]